MPSLTVMQVTQRIKNLIGSEPALKDLGVEGEVSNCAQSAPGHMYFSLKDAHAQLRCVLWRSHVAHLEHRPANSEAVDAHGYVSVYEVQDRYQLYVDRVRLAGTGELFLQFQALKDRLQREGLFGAERKRALPKLPRCLSIETSPTGGAIRDVLHVLQRRYPLAEVILAPTLVKGDRAPAQIVGGIEALNGHANARATMVTSERGCLKEL